MFAMKHTADGRYRVNVGVVNPTAVASHYDVRMFDQTGNNPPTGSASVGVDLPPYSMVQLNDPFAAVNGGQWNNYEIRVICDTDGGGTLAYASVVDNATNDAFFARGVKKRLQSYTPGLNSTQHRDGWLLAAARAPGLQGSIWRTDVWVWRDSGSDSTLRLYFCRSGQDNSAVVPIELELPGAQHGNHWEDIVETLLHVGDEPWLGAIRYECDDELQIWARVYSISPDGARSYGQLVEGIPTEDMTMAFGTPGFPGTREDQWMAAGKHTADGRFRVNVGAVNPTQVASRFWVRMYDSHTGSLEPGGTEIQMPPYSMVQLTDPFAAVDGGEWSEKLIRVEAEASGSGAFGYVSVVDNATNDAYFVRGIKLLPYDGS